MVDIDSETLFNGAAAIVATVAVVIFVLNVDFAYSPVSKVALVVAFLSGVLAITQRTSDHQLTVFGYGVIVTACVALFFDVVNTFDLGDSLTVVGLLCIAGALFALRTRLDEESRFVSGRRALTLFGVVVVLAAVILLVDVGTGGLVYELQPASRIEVTDTQHEQLRIGVVTANNPTPFPERVEAPDYQVCTAGDWNAFRPPADPDGQQRAVHANTNVQDGYNEHVFGLGSKAYPIDLYLDGVNLAGETFPVQLTSGCPDEESGAPYLALFTTPADGRPYSGPLTATA